MDGLIYELPFQHHTAPRYRVGDFPIRFLFTSQQAVFFSLLDRIPDRIASNRTQKFTRSVCDTWQHSLPGMMNACKSGERHSNENENKIELQVIYYMRPALKLNIFNIHFFHTVPHGDDHVQYLPSD